MRRRDRGGETDPEREREREVVLAGHFIAYCDAPGIRSAPLCRVKDRTSHRVGETDSRHS